MAAIGFRLGVDFGTSNTVAMLAAPDMTVRQLLVDGSPVLPSAVCMTREGRLLIGRDALHAARAYPEGFEPHPKQRISEDVVLLGGIEAPVVALIGTVLSRVGAEARRVVGGAVSSVTLTYPAGWGRQRLAVLHAAAVRAGLVPVTLVPEPVAAAWSFLHAAGGRVPVGASVLVYDFGAGTFDASVVRLGPAGFEVLASGGLPDIGGLDIDAAIVEYLGTVYRERNPGVWQRLIHPATPADRRASRLLWDDVRAAKEMLSRQTSTLVHIPLFDLDAPLGREQFNQLARPILERTVQSTRAVLRQSGVPAQSVTGVFLVGGSSRIPLAATLLHQQLMIAPTVVESPELAVADGSIRARGPMPPPPHLPYPPGRGPGAGGPGGMGRPERAPQRGFTGPVPPPGPTAPIPHRPPANVPHRPPVNVPHRPPENVPPRPPARSVPGPSGSPVGPSGSPVGPSGSPVGRRDARDVPLEPTRRLEPQPLPGRPPASTPPPTPAPQPTPTPAPQPTPEPAAAAAGEATVLWPQPAGAAAPTAPTGPAGVAEPDEAFEWPDQAPDQPFEWPEPDDPVMVLDVVTPAPPPTPTPAPPEPAPAPPAEPAPRPSADAAQPTEASADAALPAEASGAERDELLRTLISVRTRMEVVERRRETLDSELSTLRRRFVLAAFADLRTLPAQADREVRVAREMLGAAERHAEGGTWSLVRTAVADTRRALTAANATMARVTERLTLLDGFARDPKVPVNRARLEVREAQRLFGMRAVADRQYATRLDALAQRIDRVERELAAPRPDYWALHGDLEQIRAETAEIVRRLRGT